MKKMLWNLMVIITVVMVLWLGLSVIEVGAKSIAPNPQLTKYNAIKMICEFGEWYHSPTGTVIDVNAEAGSIILEDENGESWVAFVDNYNEVKIGDKYKIKFDDCDTPNYIYDDELIDLKKI